MPARTQVLFWIAVAILLFGLLWLLSGILFPFVAGLILAYLLNPIVAWAAHMPLGPRRLGRTGASLLVSGVLVILLMLLMVLVTPYLVQQLMALIESLPVWAGQFQNFVVTRFGPLVERLGGAEAVSGQIRELAAQAGGLIGTALSAIWSGGWAIFDAFMLIVVTPVIAFYILIDWPRMNASLDLLIPRLHREEVHGLLLEMDQSIDGYLRGQSIVCLILGTFYAVALGVIGLQYGILIGLIAGILSFIPYVGSITGFFLAGGMALAQYWPDAWMIGLVLGIFVFGQIAEGYVLQPYIVGDAVGVHPVWVMFALFAFGVLFGFVGLLLAVPLAAVTAVLVRYAVRRYKHSKFYREDAPLL